MVALIPFDEFAYFKRIAPGCLHVSQHYQNIANIEREFGEALLASKNISECKDAQRRYRERMSRVGD